jgi:hypothetical protein
MAVLLSAKFNVELELTLDVQQRLLEGLDELGKCVTD